MTFHFTAEYSIEVLEHLISEIDRSVSGRAHIRVLGKEHFATTSRSILNENLTLVEALVEGAKAVLELAQETPDANFLKDQLYINRGKGETIIRFAQAVAPRMLEAGMTLPEAPK